MKRTYLALPVLAILLMGSCRVPEVGSADQRDIRITCRPAFQYKAKAGVNLTSLRGDDLIPFRERLVLADGVHRCEFPWPTEGISPCSFLTNLTYTFVVRPESGRSGIAWRIVGITREGMMVYAPKK